MLANTSPYPVGLKITHANGSLLYDDTGKSYIDFIAGIGVNNLGHNVPEVKAAIQKQSDQFLHVMVYGEYIQPVVTRFSEKLCSLLPSKLDTIYPVNSGTEANEAALKIAKRYTGRSEIIAFKGAYHGNTHGSMSVSYNEYKKGAFRPLLPSIRFISLNDFDDLNTITNRTAAVILETIQGDAGVQIPTQSYLKTLRAKCSATGTLLIFDEIQCGYGRTGPFNAFNHFDVKPDLLTLGKALGAGLPIGTVAGPYSVLKCIQSEPTLGHITTFGGNPLVCAAALAGLDKYTAIADRLDVENKGAYIEQQLASHHQVKAFRRIGLMIAIELKSDLHANQVIESCRNKGLLLFWFLSVPNAFRISPPLTINQKHLEEGCAIITSALDELDE